MPPLLLFTLNICIGPSILCTVLCSISEFFHNSKIHNSSKNLVLFVYILKGNSYFYSLQQYSAVCLLRNHNLFTFSMHFYHFILKKCRQIASICIKFLQLIIFVQKRHQKMDIFKKKFHRHQWDPNPRPPRRLRFEIFYSIKCHFFAVFVYLSSSQILKTILDCFTPSYQC